MIKPKKQLLIKILLITTYFNYIIAKPSISMALGNEELARRAKLAGEQAARNNETTLKNSFNNIAVQKENFGFSGINIQDANRPINELEDLGTTKLFTATKDNEGIEKVFTPENSLTRQAEMDKIGFKRDENGKTINDKGYLDKSLKITKTKVKDFDFLKGSINECQGGEQINTLYEQNTCDQYLDPKISSCYPTQIVEIDSKYNYLCNKVRDAKIKTCNDQIVSIKCKDSYECDMGGIEPGSVASDVKFEHKGGILTIGTICDNCWSGACAVYDRNTSFRIKNLSLIKEFIIFKVGFDDYLRITINGHIVYVGPHGGNKLEVKTLRDRIFGHQVVDFGTGTDRCELGTSWVRDVNIDLKSYLNEGENNLHIRVIVSGAGEGWLQIKAKQNCCNNWEIKREEICEYS